jgi:hypothetical protein
MSEESGGDYSREVRDTVVKSGIAGVGLSVLAVTLFSPAGFGGIIGTSVASALGMDRTASASDDPYAKLPPYPAPLTQSEISDIRGQLAATAASLEITRAATEDKIEYVRDLAEHPNALTLGPVHHLADVQPPAGLRGQEALATPPAATTASVAQAPAPIAPVSYSSQPRDSHLEFAALLIGEEE